MDEPPPYSRFADDKELLTPSAPPPDPYYQKSPMPSCSPGDGSGAMYPHQPQPLLAGVSSYTTPAVSSSPLQAMAAPPAPIMAAQPAPVITTVQPVPVMVPPVTQQIVVSSLPPGTCTVCRRGQIKNSASCCTWFCCLFWLPLFIIPGIIAFFCCCRKPRCDSCGYSP